MQTATKQIHHDIIHLQGKHIGNGKGFQKNMGYIIYPFINMWNEIVIHNDYKRQVIYKNENEFMKDWKDLKPYNNCKNAEYLIKKLYSKC